MALSMTRWSAQPASTAFAMRPVLWSSCRTYGRPSVSTSVHMPTTALPNSKEQHRCSEDGPVRALAGRGTSSSSAASLIADRHCAEAGVGHRRVGGGAGSGGVAIAVAVGVVAEIGAAAHDAGGAGGGAGGVGRRGTGVGVGAPPVGAPFPDVADRLPESITVRRIGANGGGGQIAVVQGVVVREFALPDVAAVSAIQVVAPRVPLANQSTAGGGLPLGFGREGTAGPGAVSGGVAPADMDHRMVVRGGCARAARVAPVGTSYAKPPGRAGNRPDHMLGPTNSQVEHGRVAEMLRFADVRRTLDEPSEVGIGDRGRVDAERIEGHRMHRPFAVAPQPVASSVTHHERLP